VFVGLLSFHTCDNLENLLTWAEFQNLNCGIDLNSSLTARKCCSLVQFIHCLILQSSWRCLVCPSQPFLLFVCLIVVGGIISKVLYSNHVIKRNRVVNSNWRWFWAIPFHYIGTILCAERRCYQSSLLGHWAQSWMGRHSDAGCLNGLIIPASSYSFWWPRKDESNSDFIEMFFFKGKLFFIPVGHVLVTHGLVMY